MSWISSEGLIRSPSLLDAEYAGLVPGQVGLYQINIRVPDPPPATLRCDTEGVGLVGGPNLVIRMGDRASSVGSLGPPNEVRVCVATADP
jgi:hypothetical protein